MPCWPPPILRPVRLARAHAASLPEDARKPLVGTPRGRRSLPSTRSSQFALMDGAPRAHESLRTCRGRWSAACPALRPLIAKTRPGVRESRKDLFAPRARRLVCGIRSRESGGGSRSRQGVGPRMLCSPSRQVPGTPLPRGDSDKCRHRVVAGSLKWDRLACQPHPQCQQRRPLVAVDKWMVVCYGMSAHCGLSPDRSVEGLTPKGLPCRTHSRQKLRGVSEPLHASAVFQREIMKEENFFGTQAHRLASACSVSRWRSANARASLTKAGLTPDGSAL